MRTILAPRTRAERRKRRHLRVRKKVAGTAGRPRLVVFRSLKHIYAQLVDDDRGQALLGVSDRSEGLQVEGTGRVAQARAVGRLLARPAGQRPPGPLSRVAVAAVTCLLLGLLVREAVCSSQLDEQRRAAGRRLESYALSLQALLDRNEALPVLKRKDLRLPRARAHNDLYTRANSGIVVGYDIRHIVEAIRAARPAGPARR